MPNPNATKKEGVQLTVVKNGANFWYFVDGKFMTSEVKDFMDTDVIPAFYAWYADVEFKDYSVKKVDKEETQQYLNEHGVYSVDAKVKGTGGKVTASQIAVAKGQKYDITITSNSGYEVSSLLINGKERLADAKRNAKGGVYTITADASNQEIEVKFQKCNGHKLSGFLKGGKNAIPGTLTITSNSNGIARYVVAANENKGYQVVMPAGSYSILAEAEDYITATVGVSLNKATTKDITLKASMFASKVTVDGKQVKSNTEVWDRSQEANGKIYGSYNSGTSLQPLYFAKTGDTAWFSSTIRYSTNFVEGGSYQSDLLGGLWVSDGARTGWFGVRQHGIVYNSNWIEHVIGYDVLATWNKQHQTVNVDFILIDGEFHVYVDGIYATKVSVTKVVPGAKKDAKLAMGLVMHADKMADIEFSNISFRTDAAQIRKDFAAKQAKHTIPSGTIFAQSVKVNNKTVESMPYRWDLTDIKKNTVTCHDGISSQPLWFAKTGKNALIQMTISRTDDFKGTTGYETQPLAGIIVSDGSKTGYFGVRASAIVTNDQWDHIIGRDIMASWSNIMSAQMEVALQDGEFHIYIDGVFIKKVKVSEVLPGVQAGTTLSLGVVSEASGKTASVKFADIKYTTDAAKVTEYLDSKDPTKAIPAGTLFAGAVTVNGKQVESVVPVWDITNIKNNVVIGNNGTATQPLLFHATGTSALVETTVTRLDDKSVSGRESQPMAGIYVTDGTKVGYIGVRASAIVINNNWDHIIGRDLFATWSTITKADIDFAIYNNEVSVYIDNLLIKKVKLSDVVPGIANDANVAVGLLMEASGKVAQMKFSDVKHTTDAAKVNAYINPAPQFNDPLFTDKVTVNGKEALSGIENWVFDGANKKATGTHTTNAVFYMAPLYFKQTGSTMLLQTTITNVSNPIKNQPLAGLYITDGTNKGGFGLFSDTIKYGQWLDKQAATLPYGVLSQWVERQSVKLEVALKNGEFHIYVDSLFVTKLAVNSVMFSGTSSGDLAVGLTIRSEQGASTSIEFSNINFTTDANKVEAFLNPSAVDPMFAESVTVNGKGVTSNTTDWVYDGANKKATGTHTTNAVFYMAPLYFKETGTSMLFQSTITNVSNPIKNQPLAGLYITDGTNKGGFGLFSNLIKYGQWLHQDAATLPYQVFTPWDTHPSVKFEVALKNGEFHIYLDNLFVTKLAVNSVMFSGTSSGDLAFGLTMRSEKGVSTSIDFSNINFTTDAAAVDAFLAPPAPAEDPMFAASLTVNSKDLTSNTADWVYDGANKTAIGTHAATNVFCMEPLYFKQTGKTMLLQTTITNDSATIKSEPMAGVYVTDGTNKGHFGLCGNGLVYGPWNEWVSVRRSYAVLSQWGNKTAKLEVAYNNGIFALYVDDVFYMNLSLGTVLPNASASTELAFGLTMRTASSEYPTVMKFGSINFTTDAAKVEEFLDEKNYDSSMEYDPSIEPFIEYARALGQGYENGVGSNKITVDENTTIFIGDSFFERRYFWTDFYTDDYKDANAFCAGIGSTTTANWTHLIKEVFAVYGDKAPKNIVMHLGTNDLWSATTTADNVVDGLKDVFEILHTKYPQTKIYYFGITHRGDNTAADRINAVNSTISTWSQSQDYLTYINTPSKITANMLMTDNLHPKLETYSVFVEELEKAGCVILDKNGQPLPTPDADAMFAASLKVNGKDVTSNTTDWVYDGANKTATGTHAATNVFYMAPLYFKETGSTMLLQTTITNDSATIKSEPMAGVYVTDGTNKGHFGLCGNGLVYGPWNEWVSNRHAYAVLSQWGNKTVKFEVAYKNGNFALYVDELFYMNLPLSTVLPSATASTELAFGLTMRTASSEFPTVMKFSNVNFTTDATAVDTFITSKQ